VRRRNLLASSSYKQRFVVLKMRGEGQGKLVEVWDSQTSDKDPYRLVLGNSWTVQSKPSNSGKRFAFQLLVADEVVLTFGCASVKDREEWMTAFDVFRKMALPVSEHPVLQASITNEKNFFSVFLSKTHSSLAIHQGQYMLSLDNEAISLHWITTAAIAHTWPRKTVQEFGMRGSNLVLKVCRAGGSSSNVVEFEFKATNSTTVAILKRWNIVLMESIAANCGNPEQMNYIGKVLNRQASDIPETGGGSRLSKSFRKRSQSTKERQTDVKRSGSFSGSRSATLRPGMLGVDTPSPQSTSGNNSPQKAPHHVPPPLPSSLAGDIGEAALPSHMQSSPPPLPPRPLRDYSSSEEDSDYAYIKEDEVKGPAKSPNSPSESPRGTGERTVDQELEDLEISMKRERKEKKRKAAQEKKRAVTMAARPSHQRPPLFFTPADPEDYLEPLSSGGNRPRSTGDYETPIPSHDRSCSEPDTSFCSDSKSLSQPTIHTLHCRPPHLSPTPELCETPPTLPSRAWRSKQSPDRSKDDSDISPYAVVRKILPGRILEETDSGAPSARNGAKSSPTSTERHELDQTPASDQSSEPAENSASSSTSPTTALNSTSDSTSAADGEAESAPPIPPRSPIKEKLSWGSSTSSVASNHSHRSSHGHAAGVRCSKCLRQRRAPVDKTLSEHRGQPLSQGMPPLHYHNEKSSLPDLNTTVSGVVPENSLQQRRQVGHRGRIPSATESRSSSDGSSSSLHSPGNYLEIVPDSGTAGSRGGTNGRGRNSDPENLQILDDFLQYFDDKVNSLNQADGSSPDQHRHAAFNSLPHSNGCTPSRRMNGVKDPPLLQRSNTLASSINHTHSPHPPHPIMSNKSLSFTTGARSPAPPVPPRSDISLGGQGRAPHYPSNHHQPLYATGYHPRPWARTGSSGSFSSTSGDSRSPPALYGGRTRQSSSSSIHSGSPSPTMAPPPHPRSWQNLARHFTQVPPENEGSSTVFIHHLRHDRRVMHSHMV
jgi:hypothetical protein